MNLIDIAIIVFALFYGYNGFKTGIIKSIFSLVAIVLSVYSAFTFYNDINIYLKDIVSNDYLSIALSFILIFVVVNYAINKLKELFEHSIDKLYLGWVNRFLGAVFNFLKGALLAGFILFLITGFSKSSTINELTKYSKISPVLLAFFNRVVVFINKNIPDDIHKKLLEYGGKLDKVTK